MPIFVTLVLDSGAFLENIDDDPDELNVGYFESDKDNNGNEVSDIRVYGNGELLPSRHHKLGKGTINITLINNKAAVKGVTIADSLKKNLLRKTELFGNNPPEYDRNGFDCVLHFTAGHFRCSKVKDRRFVEATVGTWQKTGPDKHTRPIAHDVLVHYELQDGEKLEIERINGPVLFTTEDLPAGTRHVEIEILTNNSTATKFFCTAFDLQGRKTCWLPNQGDPTSTGNP